MTFELIYYSNNTKGDEISGTYTTPTHLLTDVFETDGYVLHSWNTMPDGSGTTYEKNKYIGTDEEGQAIGGELYAIWKINNEGQIKIKNGDSVVDISDICNSIYMVCGKNQPYNYITFQVIKNLFNNTDEGGYWSARQVLDPTAIKPELIQRQTKVLVDVYGIKGEWIFEKVDEKQNSVWAMTAVSQAYSLKSTTLETLLSFTYEYSGNTFKITFTKIDNVQRTATKVSDGRYTVKLPVQFRNNRNTLISDNITIYIDATQIPSIEKVTGSGSAIVSFIARYCGGYVENQTSGKIYIDDGFIYDFTNGNPDYTEVQSAYTQLEIEQIKSRSKLSLIGEINAVSYNAYDIEIRPDEYCSSIVESIGYLTNRSIFFDKNAYFVDYQIGEGDSKSDILQSEFVNPLTYDIADKIKVDWGGSNEVVDGYFIPEIAGLSANADQGSKYILQSQKVISENYERTISISDSMSSLSGPDIKYMYREKVDSQFVFDTKIRNFQTSIIALNQIVNWYKPGDCIEYNMVEAKRQYTYTAEIYEELQMYSAGIGDKSYVALVIAPTDFKGKVYTGVKDGSGNWVWPNVADYTEERYGNLERNETYGIYSICKEVKDLQNGFTLYNVPLSQVMISYPSCTTTYTWGNPYFMDEESQISSIDAITSDSTLDNTSDTQISDNYAAKIVVGNQSLAELTDERDGFTGLILEKNWDVDLFRLAGYKDGVIQAQFNTEGKITAGGGVVELDETGMKTYASPKDVGTDKWVTHIDTMGAFNTGNKGGVGYVRLNGAGLNIFYNKDPTSQANAINFRNVAETNSKITTQLYNDYQNNRIVSHIRTYTDNEGVPTTLELRCAGQAIGPSGVLPVSNFISDATLNSTNVQSITGANNLITRVDGTATVTHNRDPEGSEYTYIISSPTKYIDLSPYVRVGSTVSLDLDFASTASSGILLPYKVNTYVSVILGDDSEIATGVKETNILGTRSFNIDLTGISTIKSIRVHSESNGVIYSGIFKNLRFTTKSIPSTTGMLSIVPDDPIPIQTPNSTTMGTSSTDDQHIHIGKTIIKGEIEVYDSKNPNLQIIRTYHSSFLGVDYKYLDLNNIDGFYTDGVTRDAFIDRWVSWGFVRNSEVETKKKDAIDNISPDDLMDKIVSSPSAMDKLVKALKDRGV